MTSLSASDDDSDFSSSSNSYVSSSSSSTGVFAPPPPPMAVSSAESAGMLRGAVSKFGVRLASHAMPPTGPTSEAGSVEGKSVFGASIAKALEQRKRDRMERERLRIEKVRTEEAQQPELVRKDKEVGVFMTAAYKAVLGKHGGELENAIVHSSVRTGSSKNEPPGEEEDEDPLASYIRSLEAQANDLGEEPECSGDSEPPLDKPVIQKTSAHRTVSPAGVEKKGTEVSGNLTSSLLRDERKKKDECLPKQDSDSKGVAYLSLLQEKLLTFYELRSLSEKSDDRIISQFS